MIWIIMILFLVVVVIFSVSFVIKAPKDIDNDSSNDPYSG